MFSVMAKAAGWSTPKTVSCSTIETTLAYVSALLDIEDIRIIKVVVR